MGSTGSPLSGDAYDWIYQKVKSDLWLAPISGGTDLSGAFVLGHPGMPVRKGEMQCRALGNAVRAFDEDGRDLIGQVGELVVQSPFLRCRFISGEIRTAHAFMRAILTPTPECGDMVTGLK